MRSPPDANRPSPLLWGQRFPSPHVPFYANAEPPEAANAPCFPLRIRACIPFAFTLRVMGALLSFFWPPTVAGQWLAPLGQILRGRGVVGCCPCARGWKLRRVKDPFAEAQSRACCLWPLASCRPLCSPCAPPPTAVPPARLGVTLSVHLLYSPLGVAQISTRGAGFLHFHPALPAFG